MRHYSSWRYVQIFCPPRVLLVRKLLASILVFVLGLFTPGAVLTREFLSIRSDGTPERRPVPPRRQDLDRASGSGLSHDERVSDPGGAPNSIVHDEKKDGPQSVENDPIDADDAQGHI